jgi:hypothetical protein
MLRAETEQVAGLAVGKQAFIFAELMLHLDLRVEALQQLRGRQIGRATVIADADLPTALAQLDQRERTISKSLEPYTLAPQLTK